MPASSSIVGAISITWRTASLLIVPAPRTPGPLTINGERMPPSDKKPLYSRNGVIPTVAQPGPYSAYVPFRPHMKGLFSAKLTAAWNDPMVPVWPLSMARRLLPSAPLSEKKMMTVLSYSPISFR